MKLTQKHIVNKVYVVVNAPSVQVANELKNSLDVFLKERVFPQLEKILGALAVNMPSSIVQISRLDLEIEGDFKNDMNKLERTIIEEAMVGIKKKISAPNHEEEVVFLKASEGFLHAFLFFLSDGVRPWYANNESTLFTANVIQQIRKADAFKSLFKEKLKSKIVLDRLLKQFNTKTVLLLLKTAYENDKVLQIINELFESNESITAPDQQYWPVIIEYLINQNIKPIKKLYQIETELNIEQQIVEPTSIWKEAIVEIGNYFNFETTIANDKKDRSDLDEKDNAKMKLSESEKEISEIKMIKEGSSYVENAGLVLLHPFLKPFFKNCNFLDADENLTNKELAIHLLHYLATKKEQQWEHQMLFEKFLCGVPFAHPISRHIVISDKLKTESEDLLKSVLEQWETLKNASPDLLRNEFLKRNGKLILNGKNPKLIVERKTQDILMNKIPWTIGVCKLPWHKEMLFTDW